jgi:DNA-binding transcriptional ArsR family regulator
MKRVTAQRKSLATDSTQTQGSQLDRDGCRSVAILAKGIADENRLRILMSMVGTRKSVTRIVEEVGLSQPLVSHHLRELRRCLLVDIQREGPFVYYGLADPRVIEVVGTLSAVAASLVAGRTSL